MILADGSMFALTVTLVGPNTAMLAVPPTLILALPPAVCISKDVVPLTILSPRIFPLRVALPLTERSPVITVLPVTDNPVKVPTLVKLDVKTFALMVLPVNALAATPVAVTSVN